jgi:peptidyl-prolyl cis-trans isomerase D
MMRPDFTAALPAGHSATNSEPLPMLRGIHNASKNWIGRAIMGVVLGLIAISFTVWGVADMFKGFGRSTVATIGKTEITTEQFRNLFNQQLQTLGRQVGRPVGLEQARALGLDRQFLGQLIAEAALDERARSLGLGLADADVAKRIMNDASFKNPVNGQFDRQRFEGLLRENGFNEQRFVAEQRRVALRRQIAETVAGEIKTPQTVMEAVNRHQNETRGIDYFVLGLAQAEGIPAPTPEQLASYFEERKPLFRAPEYRKIITLALTPESLGEATEISDADVRKAFEQQRDRYVTPERRHIQQMMFPDEASITAAKERLDKGETFAAIATERGLKETDIDLGTLTKAAVLDRAVADAAFALKEGEVSAPVKGRFGTGLVRVVKIEPQAERPFEAVSGDIRKDLAAVQGKERLLKLYDAIEDERAGGKTLTEIAQNQKLKVETFEAVDRAGRAPDGKPLQMPSGADVVTPAFTSDVGVENDPLQAGGGYVWYETAGITPSRERKLDEVKDQVEARWRDDEVAKKLKALSDEMVEKVKNGAKLADILPWGAKLETATGLKRGQPTPNLSADVLNAVFRTSKDAAGQAEGGQPSSRVVFVVKDINVPTLDVASAEAKQLGDTLRRSISDDLLGQYIARLQRDVGANINQAALNQATGVSTGQ